MCKKEKKKSNTLIIWSILISLCGIITIVAFCITNHCDKVIKLELMDLLSSIVGIVGVFATIELGCVAVLQTKYYQEESNKNSKDREVEIDSINNKFLDIQNNISNILTQMQEIESGKRLPYIRIFHSNYNPYGTTYKLELENLNGLFGFTLRIQNLSQDTISAIKIVSYKINKIEYAIKKEIKQDFALNSGEILLIELYKDVSKECLIEMKMEAANVLGEIYIIEYKIKISVDDKNNEKYIGEYIKKPYLKVA